MITSRSLAGPGVRVSLARTRGVSTSCRIKRRMASRIVFTGFNHHTVLGLHRALTSGVLRLRGSDVCGGCVSGMNAVVGTRMCRV